MSIEIQKSHIREWIWTILSIVYIFSPLDILPDVPVIGWLDDFFIVATAVLNLIQGYTEDNNQSLSRLLRIFKWVLIVLGVICIVLVLLLGALIVQLLSS